MKNLNLFLAITFCTSLILSSCSQQLYSYRQKVPANKSIAKAHKEIPSVLTENNSVASVETEKINPIVTTKSKPSTKIIIKDKTLVPIIASIKQMAPQGGSKASGIASYLSFKPVQQQLKAINKNLQSLHSINIDGRRWMVIGAVLLVIALVISIISFGIFGSLLWAIGGLIFIIGLIFYLLDNL